MRIRLFIIRKPIFFFFILPLIALIVIGICIFSVSSVVQIFNEDRQIFSEYPGREPKLAIIIDDFGQSREGVAEMMDINAHLTFAVMPFLQFSEQDARTAHDKGFEVIVHLPMEPYNGKPSWLGPHPILAGMDEEEVRQIVKASFESVPFAAGANNHMGSKATSDENIVSSILDVIKEKNLYFVDSKTGTRQLSKKIAGEKGVICFDRDVFLDGNRSKSEIKKQLQEAEKIALKKGKAVAIGHVGQEGGKVTAQAINEMLDEFEANGIKLSFISELQD